MTLTAAQIRALAPAPGYRKIDRYMPSPYRRALDDKKTPMAALTKSWRDGLKRVDHELSMVQRSRAVAFFGDLDDGGRLGALHDQTPWPEEDVEAFRIRLAELARLAVAGAASARRMLSLIGLATGARLINVVPASKADYSVAHDGTTLSGTKGQGQTRGFFVKPGEDGAFFTGDVFDAPERLFHQDAQLIRGPNYTFRLRNAAAAGIPDILGNGSRDYPYPVFRLEAGETVGPLMLIQSFDDPPLLAPRAIVINRTLRAGSILDIDVAGMAWNHDEGTTTTIGPWLLNGKKEALYAGLTEVAGWRSRFDNEPGEPAAGYAMTLRAKAGLEFDGALDDLMIDKGAIAADAKIQMPSLLGQGRSLWRVVRILPDSDGSRDIMNARFEPLPRDTKLKISARWLGRRAGEFAVYVEDKYLDLAINGPLPDRAAWLDAMVDRFKLAGTVRVAPAVGELFAGQSETALQMTFESGAEVSAEVDIEPWGEFESTIKIEDSVIIADELPLDFGDTTVQLSDALEVTAERQDLVLESDARVEDAIELEVTGETALESGVDLSDSIELTVLLTDNDDVRPPRPGPSPNPETDSDRPSRPTRPQSRTLRFNSRVRPSSKVTIRKLRS
ncbi:MAG: hypothetical protein AAGK00_00900 [Pseudomonadota bacterium]